jgi:hypothetical protein
MKKNIGLAVILPIMISAFGLLYSSKTAGIVIVIINIFLGIILLNTGNIQSLLLFQLFLCPFTILWSVFIAKRKNEFVERNLIAPSDLEFNISGDAIMQTLIVLFFTCGITAFVSQFNELNFLTVNIYMFILLEIVLTVVIANLPDTQNKENIIVKKI